MSVVSGLRSGLRSALRSGLNPGSGVSMAAVSRDATSNIYVPASSTEWTDTMAVAGLSSGNPSDLYLLQEASGNAADAIGTKILTAAGTLSYQQTVAGWTRKSIKITEAVAGKLTNATYGNVNATSQLILLYAQVATPVTQRTVMRIGDTFDADAAVELLATPLLALNNGATQTNCASNPTGAVRPIVLRIDDTANTVTIMTDQEVVASGVAQACAGTELCLGGDNVQTWLPAAADYLYCAVFTGAAAQLSNAQVKTLLQTLSWSVAW